MLFSIHNGTGGRGVRNLSWDDCTLEQQDYIDKLLKEITEELRSIRRVDMDVAIIKERLQSAMSSQSIMSSTVNEALKRLENNTEITKRALEKLTEIESLQKSIPSLATRVLNIETRLNWWVWLWGGGAAMSLYLLKEVITDWWKGGPN